MWVVTVVFVLLAISFIIGLWFDNPESDMSYRFKEFLTSQLLCFALIAFTSFVVFALCESVSDRNERKQQEEKEAFDDGMNDSTNGLPYNNRWAGNAYDQYRNGFVTGKKKE